MGWGGGESEKAIGSGPATRLETLKMYYAIK
jgi:hypothetical protein